MTVFTSYQDLSTEEFGGMLLRTLASALQGTENNLSTENHKKRFARGLSGVTLLLL